MSNEKKIILSWSGGKDCTITLHSLKQDRETEIIALMTTLQARSELLPIHQIRGEMLDQQAKSLGIKLDKIHLQENPSDLEYEKRLRGYFTTIDKDVTIAYGDVHLEGIRKYRESIHNKTGIPCAFPVWGRDPREMAETFINAGFKAIVVSVDLAKLDISYAGRDYDRLFLESLPPSVDPCGENGEFHTFVYDGPIFHKPIQFQHHGVKTHKIEAGKYVLETAYAELSPVDKP